MRAFVAQRGSWIRVLFAWLLPLAACILQWVFWDQLGHYPWLLMYPAVFFAARSGGLAGGVGATVLAALLAWWVFLPPAFSFAVNQLTNLLAVAVFFVTGIAFSIFDQTLRKSQEQYRTLFDRAGDGIVRVSRQGRFLETNDRFAAMLGRTREEIIGALVFDLVAGMTPPLWDDLDRQLQAGNSLVQEHQLRQAGGTLLPVDMTVTILQNGDHLAVVHDTSQRKQAELALRESEEKFAKIFHSSPIALSISRISGELIDVNASYTRVFGYTRADVIGCTSLQLGLFTPAERTAAIAILDEQGEVHNFPFAVHCKSGEAKECLTSIATIDLPQGQSLLFSTIDISALKRLDAAVRASEERLRWALDASNEGLWDWDIATGAIVGNDQWFRLFGYEPGETPALVNLWSNVLHPDDAPVAQRILDDYLQGRRPDYRSEYRIVTKSGEIRWNQSVGKIVARDAAGQPLRMVGTNADITARKTAELQLRDSEDRFRLIVQNSPVPILIWDEDATIRYISPTFASVFGVTAQQMLATAQALQASTAQLTDAELTFAHLAARGNIQEAAAARWLPVLRAVRHCAQHLGDRTQIDINFIMPSGEWRYLHIIFQGFRNSAAAVEIVSVVHDVSEHLSLQRLLEETNAELEQQVAARTAELQASVEELHRANAGKDAFLAAISHELRTPLTGVLSMSELLASEERGPLNSHQAKYVNAIMESGERLLATVNSVLLYTDLIAGNVPLQRELCQLDRLCAAAVRAVQADAMRKQQRITHEIIPADLEIESDVQGLINIIKILLANAIKFTPAAGRIHLRACTVGAEAEADTVQIVVTDTGIGMSEAQIGKLFRPFVQGDQTLARRFEGLGLGLAYAQKMVELLGGTTKVESELGQGSRVTVTLPVKEMGRHVPVESVAGAGSIV